MLYGTACPQHRPNISAMYVQLGLEGIPTCAIVTPTPYNAMAFQYVSYLVTLAILSP
jgi:hypothetical protein